VTPIVTRCGRCKRTLPNFEISHLCVTETEGTTVDDKTWSFEQLLDDAAAELPEDIAAIDGTLADKVALLAARLAESDSKIGQFFAGSEPAGQPIIDELHHIDGARVATLKTYIRTLIEIEALDDHDVFLLGRVHGFLDGVA